MMGSPKILHFTSMHQADDVRVFHKEVKSLVENGYDVTLIARNPASRNEGGAKLIPFKRASEGARPVRFLRNLFGMLRLVQSQDADVFHFHDLELLPVALWLRMRKHKVIFDAHESVSGQFQARKDVLGKTFAVAARMGEFVAGRTMSLIFVANPIQAGVYPVEKVVTVQNFPKVEEFEHHIDYTPYRNRDHNIVYVGGITSHRGLLEMVDAIEIVNRVTDAQLLLAGTVGNESIMGVAAERPGWEFTRYLGELNRDRVRELLAESRAGLAIMHPVPNYLSNQPVKLFEYMIAGLPAITSDFPNYRPFVSDVGAGWLVDPLNPEEIAQAILEVLMNPKEAEQMGSNGQRAVYERWTWSTQREEMLKAYRRLVG